MTVYNGQDLPRIYAPIEQQVSIYDAFGFAVVTSGDRIVFVGRRGTQHAVEAAGKMREWTSDDGGQTWSQADIVDSETHDDRNVGGGIVPSTGTILVFYSRYNADTEEWQDVRYVRSTDAGATFNDIGEIVMDDDVPQSYGQLIELPSGKLIKNFHGHNGTYRVFVQFSEDDGLTWGDEVSVYSGATRYVEGAMAKISGTTDANTQLVIVIRNIGGVLHQFSSTDGGQTWADDGNLLFSSGENTDVSPWLHVKAGVAYLVYGDRTAGAIRYMQAIAANVPGNVSAWNMPITVYEQQALDIRNFGYPCIVEYGDDLHVMFYDVAGVGDPDIYHSF